MLNSIKFLKNNFIPSESNNTDYPIQAIIDFWHEAKHPSLVIAYIDFGYEEDLRTGEENIWEIGYPEWFESGDPDA